ncbi:hypothetical protein KCU65_g2453, partial [Aureobasidium melanogenum]
MRPRWLVSLNSSKDDNISDVKAAILLNLTPQEIYQMKKHIRCYLRAPCPWTAPENLVDNADKTLCLKDEHPLGWMMSASRQGVLFRHLVIPPVAKLYPELFAEPDLETQIRQDQPNGYGRFSQALFVVCREVLVRLIEACAQEMREHSWSVAELLEQEKAIRAQPRNAPSSPISPTKDRKNSTPSTASNDNIPTRGERLDRAVVERKRLYIHNMAPWTRKRNVADFFSNHRVGMITMYVSDADNKSCAADFYSPEQAKHAMEDLDRTPLLGRMVDIELAKSSLRLDVEENETHPLPVKPRVRRRMP